MRSFTAPPFRALLLSAAVSLLIPTFGGAQTVWSGYGFSFTKAVSTNPALPENQDRLTGNVWLTRNVNQGIYNIHDEAGYTSTSPAGTTWATDLNNPSATIAASNWNNLTFTNWVDAYGGQGTQQLPSRLIGRNAVMHLLADNIYLDLRFTGWSHGSGGFAYDRAMPPEPPPPTGDYNENGVVDAADYVIWRKTEGQTGVTPGTGADGNRNGSIDAGDYIHWRERFGNIVGGGAAVVPEPAVGAMVALTLLTGFICHQRRRR